MLEVLVALSIGAVVLMSARTLLDGLAEHARSTVRATHGGDERANAERTVRQIVSNIELAPLPQPSFVGTPAEAIFGSWCPSARGGLERCRVRLALSRAAGEPAVVLSSSVGANITLLRGSPLRLRYLTDAADAGRWDDQWPTTQTPPLAIEASAGRRIVLLRIGERR